MLSRVGIHEHQVTVFTGDQKQTGIFNQQYLAFAVTPTLPLHFAGREINAGEYQCVKSIRMALIDDKVIEIRLELA